MDLRSEAKKIRNERRDRYGKNVIRIVDISSGKRKTARNFLWSIRGCDEPEEIASVLTRQAQVAESHSDTAYFYRREYDFDDILGHYLLAGMVQYLHELKGLG